MSGVRGLCLEDFYLASDRERHQGVHLIAWRDLVDKVIHPVFLDDVVSIRTLTRSDGEDLRIPSSSAHLTEAQSDRALDLYLGLSQGHEKAARRFLIGWMTDLGVEPQKAERETDQLLNLSRDRRRD